ncbi:MAG: hypothetical protein RL514_3024 [Verrucomicrobiota bacterium]|jgi:hypothetical protein
MIDTKIACQCGNQFKFSMDLVNGRAPDGLACPTCGAPATAACNALVDFLSGREPAPPSADTRPLKQVRVVCPCGARYKFDLELAEQTMPSPVVCPNCQVDLTPLANEEIRGYIAKHAGDLAAPATAPVAAPTPAAAPTPEPVAAMPIAEPVLPATPTAPAPEPTPPVPASAPVPAPESPSPAAPAPSVTPVSDPFGPATGKSTGPNLKPLEVPKPNRPPPGSRPAAPAKPASPPPTKPAAHAAPAASAKSIAKHSHAHPAVSTGAPTLGRGAGGAVAGALLGAAIWFALLQVPASLDSAGKATALPTSWMAIVVGVLAGFGARWLGRGAGSALGGLTCGAATIVICLMAWTTMMRHVDRQVGPQLKTRYLNELANAQAVAKATDAELKVIVAQRTQNFGMGGSPSAVTDAQLKAFRDTELPKLRDFAAGKPSRAEWESQARSSARAGIEIVDLWEESIGIFGLLFFIAGILAAAKIPVK